MIIEEGKFYRTRAGNMVGPVYINWADTKTWRWKADVGLVTMYYEASGFSCPGRRDHHADGDDLVAEWGDEPAANDPVALTNERKNQHGDWTTQAWLSSALKDRMHESQNWAGLSNGQQEALDMIAVKISRILSGDPNHADHWNDIAGYAYLGKGGHKT